MEEMVVEVRQYSPLKLPLSLVREEMVVEVRQYSPLKLPLALVREEVVVTKYSPLQ